MSNGPDKKHSKEAEPHGPPLSPEIRRRTLEGIKEEERQGVLRPRKRGPDLVFDENG